MDEEINPGELDGMHIDGEEEFEEDGVTPKKKPPVGEDEEEEDEADTDADDEELM